MSTTVRKFIDDRQPKRCEGLSDRFPIGAVVAYGPGKMDGFECRTTGVVASVDEVEGVTISDGDVKRTFATNELDDLAVLARSTSHYVQKLCDTARRLKENRNYCDVVDNAVREINATLDEPRFLLVEVTTVEQHRIVPLAYDEEFSRRNYLRSEEGLNRLVQDYGPRTGFFDHCIDTERRTVSATVRLVDDFGDDETETETSE